MRVHWSQEGTTETRPDSYIGFLYPPNSQGRVTSRDFDFSYTTDAHGFRNTGPWPERADVVAVGDSEVFGWGVSADSAWTARVSGSLNVCVMNLGLPGMAPTQYLRVYERFGSALRPRVVLFGLFPGNDLTDEREFDSWLAAGSPGNFSTWKFNHGASPGLVKRFMEHSYLYWLAREGMTGNRDNESVKPVRFADGSRIRFAPVFLSRQAGLARPDRPEFKRVMQVVDETRALAERDSAAFLVLLFPTKEEVYLPLRGDSVPPVLPVFAHALAEQGVPYLDLTVPLQEEARKGKRLFFEVDGHPDATGYRVIADAVVTHLRQHAEEFHSRRLSSPARRGGGAPGRSHRREGTAGTSRRGSSGARPRPAIRSRAIIGRATGGASNTPDDCRTCRGPPAVTGSVLSPTSILLGVQGRTRIASPFEWSRLEPDDGQWDSEALRHYERVIESLRDRGMEPVVTLNHFTLPHWVACRGGWASPRIVGWFARYVDRVARAIGDRVRYWVTLNEPTVLVKHAYVTGDWPPCRRRAWMAAARAFVNMARAHRLARERVRQQVPSARVGFAHSAPVIEPCDADRRLDRAAAWLRDLVLNRTFFMLVGALPWRAEPPFDFVGLNYYTRTVVRGGRGIIPLAGRECLADHHPDRGPRSDTGWEIYPSGLGKTLQRFSAFGVPLLVTENGVATTDEALRARFLSDHLAQIAEALGQGIDVRGYFYWSLIDNFEWALGTSPRFGLIGVDFDTQQRLPRPALERYGAACTTYRVPGPTDPGSADRGSDPRRLG